MVDEPYWISNLAPSEVVSRLEEWGLSCDGPLDRGRSMNEWECEGSDDSGSVAYQVSIVGRDPEQRVRSVDARVRGEDGMPPEREAADFLGFVAAIPYEGQDASQVRDWTQDKLTSGGKLEMGGATLELEQGEDTRTLRLVAARPGMG